MIAAIETGTRAVHVTAGARDELRLVLGDEDRFDLAERLAHPRLLDYVIMDTHVQAVYAGRADHVEEAFAIELRGYIRAFRKRHGGADLELRGPIDVRSKTTPRELARAIWYDHENPAATRLPMVAEAAHFEWSTQREWSGLSLAGRANVALGRKMLGDCLKYAWHPAPDVTVDETRAAVPTASPELILVAAAQTFGILPRHVAGNELDPRFVAARRCYARVGWLQSYTDAQLAPTLRLKRRRLQQLRHEEPNRRALAIAQTLLRDPPLRARLQRVVDCQKKAI